MNIDQNAPLRAEKEALIAAPAGRVWSLLTGIDDWAGWQPDVDSAHLEGELAQGAVFHWKARGMAIESTIRELEAGRRVGWTGNSLGMRAAHRWRIEAGVGGTRVFTEESLSGWFPALIKFFDPGFLDKSLVNSLLTLKKEAEKAAKN